MGLKDNLRELDAVRRMLGASASGAAFGQEVRQARTRRGMTLEALSAATGMAKSYLSQIETGYAPPPRDEKVRKLAEALGLDAEGLLARAHLSQMPDDVKARMARLRDVFDSTEEVIRALLAAREESKGAEAAVAAAPGAPASAAPEAPAGLDLDALHRSGLLEQLADWGDRRASPTAHVRAIPVINKLSAGYPADFTDLGYPVGFADEYISAPVDLEDPNAFAVRVVGDSMEPRYHEGDIVIFSPAMAVHSGDDCFVRFGMTGGPSEGQSTFKRVFFDGDEQLRLQPLNERYAPTITRPADVAGIFRAAARYEKL